ncbi:hypothetical protein HAX54_029792 [Datura stramonium]|uniref:Uncharacterized protein n=1 Tax=Datura stramonium TaxID=4076 RepID=A0ABS8V9T6_DATST|nr:hypothetical protein [Datura stramonium]
MVKALKGFDERGREGRRLESIPVVCVLVRSSRLWRGCRWFVRFERMREKRVMRKGRRLAEKRKGKNELGFRGIGWNTISQTLGYKGGSTSMPLKRWLLTLKIFEVSIVILNESSTFQLATYNMHNCKILKPGGVPQK